ncbi:hypothetical protein VTH82DRAFT_5415 [Thermothelomyces myriococcoides]
MDGSTSSMHRGILIAPPDPNARWDDPGYDHPEHRIGVMGITTIFNNRRGFAIHEACWCLVEKAYYPDPVPCTRLFDVLNSVPRLFMRNIIDWGGDYALFPEDGYFPWEHLRFSTKYFPSDSGLEAVHSTDPLVSSEFQEILADTPQTPPTWDYPSGPSFATAEPPSGQDPFSLLPEELCAAIAAYLPTRDVLNARLASRSFRFAFRSQQFWASRFQGKFSERSWLFEDARNIDKAGGNMARDWRWLYRRTADARLGNAAQNRKRIWALIQHLMDITELSWNELIPQTESLGWPAPLRLVSDKERFEEPWISVKGGIPEHGNLYGGLLTTCIPSKTQCVAIRVDAISQVAALTVRLGKSVYIAGLSLTSTNGQVMRFGYNMAASAQSSCVQLCAAPLTGLNVAVGLGGIHALQFVSGRGTERQPSPWLGDPDAAPKTERLSDIVAPDEETMVLEFGFDAFRMVSVGAVRLIESPISSSRRAEENSLRHSALWYPHVPPPTVDLNEASFQEPGTYVSEFKPMFWTRFGGPGGMYLRNLFKMHFSTIAVAALAAVASASPTIKRQAECPEADQIPECGYDCIVNAAADLGCQAEEYKCMCDQFEALQSAAATCVLTNCGIDEALNVISAAEAVCAACA